MSLSNPPATVEGMELILRGALLLSPPSINPFLLLRSQLAKSVTYKAPKSADPLLILGSILLAIVSGIFVAGFIIRWNRGTLWLYRVVRAGRESYLLGSMLAWKGGFDMITSMTLQIFVWMSWRANQGEVVRHKLLAYILPWLPGGVAAALALWCLSVTYILHLRTYSSETARTPWYISAKLINTVGILLPFVILGSTLPFAIRASISYEKGVADYIATDTLLAEAEDGWKPNEAIDLTVVDEIAPLLFDALGAFDHSKIWFQRIYFLLAGWCAAFTFAFALVGYLYARALNTTISEMSSRSSKGVGIAMFTKTRRWLLSLSACFVVSMAAVCIHGVWIGIYCERLLVDGLLNELAVILPVYTIAIMGLPISIMLLLHACSTPSSASVIATSSLPDQTYSIDLTRSSPSATEMSQHYTQLQFSLAAQLPLPNRPFFGLTTKPESESRERPFDSLELTTRNRNDHEGQPKIGVSIERQVTVVTLSKLADWTDEVEELEKW